MPKISILLQFEGEILALLHVCPDDCMQILLILSQFQTLRTETKLEDADFWQVGVFHHALSEYTNKSHNFKNSNICDVTL